MAALAVAIQRTGCDVAQARMSELERDEGDWRDPSRPKYASALADGAVTNYRARTSNNNPSVPRKMISQNKSIVISGCLELAPHVFVRKRKKEAASPDGLF